MEEQKIKQDIRIGANIRRIRKNRGIKPMALVRLLQLEGVEITRESLVKIERGAQHIKASQLRGIRDALHTRMTNAGGGRETRACCPPSWTSSSQPSAPSAAVFWTDRASVAPVAGSFPGRREPTPCAGGPAAFSARAPLWYQGLAREGLHRFKFRGMSSAAAPLGELIAGCAAEHFSGAFDTVTWVPVSPRRLASAGVWTRPACWRRAPAACGRRSRCRCCARPSTTPPSRD